MMTIALSIVVFIVGVVSAGMRSASDFIPEQDDPTPPFDRFPEARLALGGLAPAGP